MALTGVDRPDSVSVRVSQLERICVMYASVNGVHSGCCTEAAGLEMYVPRFSSVIVVYHLPGAHTSSAVIQRNVASVLADSVFYGTVALQVIRRAETGTVDMFIFLRMDTCR